MKYNRPLRSKLKSQRLRDRHCPNGDISSRDAILRDTDSLSALSAPLLLFYARAYFASENFKEFERFLRLALKKDSALLLHGDVQVWNKDCVENFGVSILELLESSTNDGCVESLYETYNQKRKSNTPGTFLEYILSKD